jgi:peptidoglycan/xylan/chitin deacetylase (PgdA/CDA1 family)
MHYKNLHPKESYKGSRPNQNPLRSRKTLIILLAVTLAALIFVISLSAGDGTGRDRSDSSLVSDAPAIALPSPARVTSGEGIETEQANLTLDRALIVFTFDDGNESDYLLAFPILQKYGIAGTSFINPYNPDHNVKTKLSWAEIKQMYAAGWDFEDHTYTHIALAESTASEIKLSAEMVDSAFLRNGLPVPDTLAYPYGNYNQSVIDVITQYRKQARLALYADDFADLNNIKPYEIPSVSADMQTEKSLSEKQQIVDKACEQHAVIIFMFHCLYNNEKNDMGSQPVQTSSVLFARLVDYCAAKGCKFMTMNELLKLYTGS